MERVTLDGTKIKANASGNTTRRKEKLEAHLAAAQEQVQGEPKSKPIWDRPLFAAEGHECQTISNPFQIIAGHEVLGHAYSSDILGLTKGMTPAQEEIWVRQYIENTLRQEQGLPLRDPYSN